MAESREERKQNNNTQKLLEELKPVPLEKFDLKERLESLRVWRMLSARSKIIVG